MKGLAKKYQNQSNPVKKKSSSLNIVILIFLYTGTKSLEFSKIS
jgi:hypothetical protein